MFSNIADGYVFLLILVYNSTLIGFYSLISIVLLVTSMRNLFTTLLILLFSAYGYAARVDTITLQSKILGKSKKICIVLPTTYADKPFSHYNTLYLLHGAGGKYSSFLKQLKDSTLLHRLADLYQLILVMPDADTMSYYVDRRSSNGHAIASYLGKELVKKIDATYRTKAKRRHRAIAGFSMGGHGALYLASQYPKLFCSAGSMSGAVDLNTQHWKRDAKFRRLRDSTFTVLMGPKAADTANPFPDYSAITRIKKIKRANVALNIDCGVDDFLIGPNRVLKARLEEANIPHTYTECPGKHDWDYWTKMLPAHVAFAARVMEQGK